MTLIIRQWGLSYAPIKMKSWPNTRWAASAIKFSPPRWKMNFREDENP